jgi:predicted PurR-regulated permease PerM
MLQNIVLIIILLTLAYLYDEFKKLRKNTKKYSDKTNGFITQLYDLIDQTSKKEVEIFTEMAKRLEKRGNE